MGGCQFSGATQLLPLGASPEQCDLALGSLITNLKGQIPTTGHCELKLARNAFAWKEFRTSTKNLLCAIANSLRQYLPDGWSLANCKPHNLLAPMSPTGERVQYLPEELNLRPELKDMDTFFIHDMKTGVRRPDFFLEETHYKLVFSADEGTEASLMLNFSCFNVKHLFERR